MMFLYFFSKCGGVMELMYVKVNYRQDSDAESSPAGEGVAA